MSLRVFSDGAKNLHVEITHANISHSVRLSVPMLRPNDGLLPRIDPRFRIPVRFGGEVFQIPFAIINTEVLWRTHTLQIGDLDESDSRNVLNNLVDILGY